MENRAYAIAAGMFTLLFVAALVVVVIWFTGDPGGRVTFVLVSRVAVSGLNAKAAVRLRGVGVGEVEHIRFDPQNPRQILVRITVNPDTPVTKSTYARLAYQGVTGLSYVELDDDGSDLEPLTSAPGVATPPRIDLRPSRLDQIGDSGQLLLSDASEAARRVSLLLSDQNLAQLSHTLTNLEAASQKAAGVADQLQPTLKALPQLVAHFDATLQQVAPLVNTLDGFTTDLRRRLDLVDRVGRDADRMANAGEALGDAIVNDAVPRFRGVMDDLERTSRSLDRLLTNLNDRPQSLVFGRPPAPPDPGEPGFRSSPGARP